MRIKDGLFWSFVSFVVFYRFFFVVGIEERFALFFFGFLGVVGF